MTKRDDPIVTSRLRLRRPELTDASALQDIVGDPRVALTTSSIPHPYPEGGAKWFIQHVQNSPEADGRNLAITLGDQGDLIGMVGFSWGKKDPELAYMISPAHWGRGFATEAASGMIDYIFSHCNCDTVLARALAANPSSQAVLRKLGFLKVGQEDVQLPLRGGIFSVTIWHLNRPAE